MSRTPREADDVTVSVVIVTHNNCELIGRCLRAVFDSLGSYSAEVIVIDNASSDGTVEAISREGLPARVIELDRNIGFAGAVNSALETARGRHRALVNSDAFPDPACIANLVNALEQKPRAGIVGARLRYPSGRAQASAGTFPSLLGGLWVALFLHRVPGLSRIGVGYFTSQRLYAAGRRVDWVSAAVCAARLEAGPLPSASFMYGEDVEWAVACRDAGLEVWLEPDATAVHISRASVDQSQDAGFAQRRRAQFELAWFARRGTGAQLLARVVLVTHALLRMALYGAISALRRRRDPRVAEFSALLDAALASDPPLEMIP